MSQANCLRKWWVAAGLAAALAQGHAGEARAEDAARPSYTVKPGDSLGVIAERQGVALHLLREVNSIRGDAIRPGQVLLLPTVHEVKAGDVAGSIAERYGVKLSEFYRLNGMHEGSVLKVGQRVIVAGRDASASTKSADGRVSRGASAEASPVAKPDEPEIELYEHQVRPNEVLSVIAQRYAVSTKELSRINRLGKGSMIRVGQTLKIPVSEDNAHLTRPKRWSKYALGDFEPGKVTLKTMGGQWTGRVLDAKGNVLPAAQKRIQSMLASWETGKKVQIALDPRLYRLIVTVSDEFGGRPIRVVSGYRESSYAKNSKHRLGRALDFSIPGVPNSVLVDFLLTLPNTGVGYYPNSTHVHLDARGSRMYWVDVSGPGQAPRYVHKSSTGERAPVARATKPATRRPIADEARGERMARLDTRQR